MGNAAALIPLEEALESSGAADVLDDWRQRSRREAISDDLAKLGASPEPMAVSWTFEPCEIFGALYVLEGSRLGAKFLLSRIASSSSPVVREACAYLRHGATKPFWPSFVERLEEQRFSAEQEQKLVWSAVRSFSLFETAAAAASKSRVMTQQDADRGEERERGE